MKKYLTIVVIIAAFSACKKNNVLLPGLTGKWELRHTYGGFLSHDSIYAAGNGHMYQFNRDSTYKKFDTGSQSAQGIYHIRHDNNYQMKAGFSILFDNATSGEPIAIYEGELTIGTSVADGVTYEYVKVN